VKELHSNEQASVAHTCLTEAADLSGCRQPWQQPIHAAVLCWHCCRRDTGSSQCSTLATSVHGWKEAGYIISPAAAEYRLAALLPAYLDNSCDDGGNGAIGGGLDGIVLVPTARPWGSAHSLAQRHCCNALPQQCACAHSSVAK
jgi:hypothetical protein